MQPISVGIPNRNGERYLRDTLAGIEACSAAIDDVLLIDNGSDDGGLALARRSLPRIKVIELGRNLGPGAARNVALREARHDRVLLVDNDAVPQPGCVELLAAALDAHPRALVAMPAVLHARRPDRVQFAGADSHFLGTCRLLAAETPTDTLDPAVRSVGSAITCCLLVDRSRFGEHDGFDEDFFFYLEDHEFGLRARLLGLELLAVPEARCLHGEGSVGVSIRETGRFTAVRVRYTLRNRWLILLKLYRWTTLARLAPALALFEALQLVGSIRRGWLGHWCWSLASLTREAPALWRKRRAFQRRRRRDDLDVLVGGPFPFNDAMHVGAADRAARRLLDTVAGWNWRLAGGRS